MSANRAGDANLDCRALDAEIVRAQVIIDGVIPLGLDCADADNCVATAVTKTRQATVALYN